MSMCCRFNGFIVRRLALTVGIVLAVLGGCGGPADPGTMMVSGVVTLDGKPVDQAAIGFLGREGARLATAQTDKAGKFTIRAAMGKNVVTVAKAGAPPVLAPPSSESQLMPTTTEYQQMIQNIKTEVPAKYGDPKTSGLSVDVAEGMPKEVELALSTK
jgi:hypothetical protein